MKRFLIAFSIILFSLSAAGSNLSKTKLMALISECRCCEGAEVVQMGRFSTGALKGLLRISTLGDPDARAFLKMIRGIHGLSVFDYDDCCERDKIAINRRLDKILRGQEVLMEVHDGDSHLMAFGVVDDTGDTIKDFVLYAPTECALICIFGSVPTEKVINIINND